MKLADYDLEAVRREWIGKKIGSSRGRYPVEYDPIRRYCHMVQDLNPLFLDPEFARTGPYGAVIAPPTMIGYFTGNGAWPMARESVTTPVPNFTQGVPTPGRLGINMGTSWEYYLPVRVGDHLSSESSIADVFMKAIKLDPGAVWIVTQGRITNQDGALVALSRNTVLAHRAPEEVAADPSTEGVDR
jgi:acyl dehydratase